MEITPSITPDAAGLKVLAHPVRLEMLGMLRVEGPATATMLAQRLGLNSGATSYHLRQLAQHGFIEEDAERGNGRERWWRAAHRATRTSKEALSPDDPRHDLHASYLHAVADVYADKVRRSLDEQASAAAGVAGRLDHQRLGAAGPPGAGAGAARAAGRGDPGLARDDGRRP